MFAESLTPRRSSSRSRILASTSLFCCHYPPWWSFFLCSMCTQVDTGGSAERASCLVRTLCKLLRKVSLHALLQGAGKTVAGGGSGLQMDTPEVRDMTKTRIWWPRRSVIRKVSRKVAIVALQKAELGVKAVFGTAVVEVICRNVGWRAHSGRRVFVAALVFLGAIGMSYGGKNRCKAWFARYFLCGSAVGPKGQW